MSKERIAGFMLGLSAGFAVGYFLRPPEGGVSAREDGHAQDADATFNERSTRLSRCNRGYPYPPQPTRPSTWGSGQL